MRMSDFRGKNQRKFERLTTDLPATFTALEADIAAGGAVALDGRALNLSMDGASIETYLPRERELLHDTRRVAVEISLPHDPEPIRFTGEAMWSTEIADPAEQMTTLRFGVKVLDISARHSARLASFIKRELEEASS